MNRAESKYFNTAARMDEAFIALLGEKDFDYITVKEICEKAGVHRSTFYLHYETIDDLLRESSEYIIQKCFDRFPVKDLTGKIDSCPMEELIFVTPAFLIPYLEFVQENKTLFRVSVTKASTLNGGEAFEHMVKTIIAPVLRRFHYQPGEIGYVTTFYVSGLVAVVMEWVKHDCIEGIEKIMDIMIKVTIPNGNGIMPLGQAENYIQNSKDDWKFGAGSV